MEWFKFRTIWNDGIRELSDAEAGRFLKALIDFEEFGETRTLTGAEKVLYSIVCKQLKQDAERNAEISRSRAEAGRIGGLSSSKQKEANRSNCKQLQAKEAIESNCSIKKSELRIQNTEEENNNIAQTDVFALDNALDKKQVEITPDDHEFWKFAKENAELAETFYKASGIRPVKSQFGRWVKDLRDLAEAGISAEQLRKTINYMQSEGIPLSAPGSCLKTAQWLKARGSVPARSQKQKPQYNSFEELAMQMNGLVDQNWDVEL